jgi:hypothetical protein
MVLLSEKDLSSLPCPIHRTAGVPACTASPKRCDTEHLWLIFKNRRCQMIFAMWLIPSISQGIEGSYLEKHQ